MTTFVKSHIKQVLDEISLDFAHETFLNVITSNYGLDRPPVGFSDDQWRAIGKLIQLQEKTPSNKVRALLELLLGPLEPVANALAVDVAIGDDVIYVIDATDFPQVGTLWLDKGAANAEQINYRFVDYAANAIFLSAETQHTHVKSDFDTKRYFLGKNAGYTTLACQTVDNLTVGHQALLYSTAGSEVVTITASSVTEGYVTVTGSTLVHPRPKPTPALVTTTADYSPGSFTIRVSAGSVLPSSGLLQVIPATGASAYSATAGSTTTSVNVTGFELYSLDGYKLKFSGNVTSALAGSQAYVLTNTGTVITLNHTLPAAPASGDTFTIVPVTKYDQIDIDTNTVYLNRPFSAQVSLPANSKVEFLDAVPLIRDATVLVEAGGWSWFQAASNTIHVNLPVLTTGTNIFTSSYVSDYTSTNPATTTTAAYNSANPNDLPVSSTSTFPRTGVLRYDPSGSNLKLGYYVLDATTFRIPHPPVGFTGFGSGVAVGLHKPVYSGTLVRDGDIIANAANALVFPTWFGPYVTHPTKFVPTYKSVTLNQNLAGPTTLAVGVQPSVGPVVLEVDDAVYAPIGASYRIQAGSEIFNAIKTSLRSVALATTNSSTAIGATTVVVTGANNNSSSGGSFPEATGYRVVIGKGTTNAEIAFVTNFSLTSNAFTFFPALTKVHTSGETVTLASDCITVSQIDQAHIGSIARADAVPPSQGLQPFSAYGSKSYLAERVIFLYNKISITSNAGFSSWPQTSKLTLSHGNLPKIYSPLLQPSTTGSTALRVADVTKTPATPFKVIVGTLDSTGAAYIVSAKNSGVTPHQYTTAFPLKYDKIPQETVTFLGEKQQTLDYSSITGTDINLPGYIYFETDHGTGSKVSLTGDYQTGSLVTTTWPLRMPADAQAKIDFLIDLVRAAGVQVIFNR